LAAPLLSTSLRGPCRSSVWTSEGEVGKFPSGPGARDEVMKETTGDFPTRQCQDRYQHLLFLNWLWRASKRSRRPLTSHPLAKPGSSLYNGNYRSFFVALGAVKDQLLTQDRYLHEHRAWFVREIRLPPPTSSFFRATEPSSLFRTTALPAPSIGSMVSSRRIDQTSKNKQYADVVKHGDSLITEIQKYSQAVRLRRTHPVSRPEPQVLNVDNINQHVRDAKRVRGELAVKAETCRQRLLDGDKSLPFESVIFADIGNPQQLDQKPITFFRQVLSLVENPSLLENPEVLKESLGYKQDVIDGPGLSANMQSVGAYITARVRRGFVTASPSSLRSVMASLPTPQDLFLTAGASSGVSTILSVICNDPNAGVLVPIPQYPLYTASLTLLNATAFLTSSRRRRHRGTDINAILKSIEDAKAAGTDVHTIVMINPGNPTGTSLSPNDIKQVLNVAAKESLVVITDDIPNERFQGRKEKPGKYNNVELVSLHSISKGMVGECGHRGGYFELAGFDPLVHEQIYKLVSIGCDRRSSHKGEPSFELYQKEYNGIKKVLTSATFPCSTPSSVEGVELQEPQGAMYLFPVSPPAKAVEAAKAEGRAADEFYCLALLDATGVCVIPGSGFGQKDNAFHFRTTFLAPAPTGLSASSSFRAEFMDKYR
ncbi:hypothetical protein N7497_006179, partial [Penicillium chrysogenum]